jgi:hypothetical protein
MGEKISEGRRKIIFGGMAALALSPFKGWVDPLIEEPNFRIKAVEYFEENHGERARKLASIAFDCYDKYGKNAEYPYDPILFLAQIKQESNFGDPKLLISPVGAVGPTQVMPDTAEREPFNLKVVYNPLYYKEVRKIHRKHSFPLRRSFYKVLEGIQKITENTEFETIYRKFEGHRNKWGFIDTEEMPQDTRKWYERDLEKAREEFSRKMGREFSDKGFDYLEKLKQYDEFREKLDEVYTFYEDNLGSMIFQDYTEGDVRRMRNNLGKKFKPLELKPKEKLKELEHRVCFELVSPGSYKKMLRLMKKFEGNSLLAVAAYNAGEWRINNKKVPHIGETWDYVSLIFRNYTVFRNDLGLK